MLSYVSALIGVVRAGGGFRQARIGYLKVYMRYAETLVCLSSY